MTWNWQLENWPHFEYVLDVTDPLEKQFLLKSGSMFAIFSCLKAEEKDQLRIQLLSDEAIQTSKIEGEILDRDSVQSSLQRYFGLAKDHRRIPPAEKGISELLIDIYQRYEEELTAERIKLWHSLLMQGRQDILVGEYRTGKEPMQVVSGTMHEPVVHYEAPPSERVPQEMKRFLDWFKASKNKVPALARSAIAHVYFESIHPFEDGNGRIGRAVSELALSQSLGQPIFLALSRLIEENKKRYYAELKNAQVTLEIHEWIQYFSETILEAQKASLAGGEFLIAKTQFLDRFRGLLNPRQEKVLIRMFGEGLSGFTGGLSAANYRKISKTTTATTTRDLADLVQKKALVKTGELKGTRYFLNLSIIKTD